MATEVKKAQSAEELHEIARLRYQVFVEEMHKGYSGADHDVGTMLDAQDEYATNFYAVVDGKVVGAARNVFLSDGPFEDAEHYHLDEWREAFQPHEMSQTNRFVILPRYRKTRVAIRLVAAIYTHMREHGVQIDFLDCAEELVPFYEKLSYRRYTEPYFHAALKSSYTPMVALTEDIEYMRDIGAPVASLAERVENSSTARQFFERAFAPEFVLPVHRVIRSLGEPLRFYFTNDELAAIADGFETEEHQPGDSIVSQGEPSQSFYIIRSGRVRVSRQTKQGELELNTLGPGYFFGELGVLSGLPRTASVQAAEPTELLKLTREQLVGQLREYPPLAISILRVVARWFADLPDEPEDGGQTAPRSLPATAFQADQLADLSERFQTVELEAGQPILSQGDRGTAMFVLLTGEVEILSGESGRALGRVGPGELLGEIGPLSLMPRTASATAVRECTALRISREELLAHLQADPDFAIHILQRLARLFHARLP